MRREIGIVLLNLGLDPRKLRNLKQLLRFVRDRRRFLEAGGKIDANFPILSDFAEGAGTAKGHYFHQDLLVAQFVAQTNPQRHIDIGSRIDGFVAHVAAFREIEVMDIRPLSSTEHPQISFAQGDLMDLPASYVDATDSLSCLHALEHFGLGRYGDPIDPTGHLRAFSNMIQMVRPGGKFYLGVPVGRAAVMFNAHRVFSPQDPLHWAGTKMLLERFDYVDDAGELVQRSHPAAAADLSYGCGIYTFRRLPD